MVKPSGTAAPGLLPGAPQMAGAVDGSTLLDECAEFRNRTAQMLQRNFPGSGLGQGVAASGAACAPGPFKTPTRDLYEENPNPTLFSEPTEQAAQPNKPAPRPESRPRSVPGRSTSVGRGTNEVHRVIQTKDGPVALGADGKVVTGVNALRAIQSAREAEAKAATAAQGRIGSYQELLGTMVNHMREENTEHTQEERKDFDWKRGNNLYFEYLNEDRDWISRTGAEKTGQPERESLAIEEKRRAERAVEDAQTGNRTEDRRQDEKRAEAAVNERSEQTRTEERREAEKRAEAAANERREQTRAEERREAEKRAEAAASERREHARAEERRSEERRSAEREDRRRRDERDASDRRNRNS